MSVVPGLHNYMNSYSFVAPNINCCVCLQGDNYVCVVILTNEIDGLLSDNTKPVVLKQETAPLPLSNYSILHINVSIGYHELTHKKTNVLFGAMLYGIQLQVGYGFPLGLQTPGGQRCFAAEFVTVGNDQTVKPTTASAPVDVTLTCTGSRSELSYYIKNRILWDFIRSSDGQKYAITESFYQAPNSQYAKDNFAKGHFEFSYFADPGTKLYVFPLKIKGVNHADNGVYQCSLLNEANAVTDSKTVTLTVVNPVESLSFELYHDTHKIGQSSTPLSADDTPHVISPGQYMVKCMATGSNPAPILKLHHNENTPYTAIETHANPADGRMQYTGSFSVDALTLNAHSSPQTLSCTANIPGEFYPTKTAAISVLVQVGPDGFSFQICYSEKYVSRSGIYYKSGCLNKDTCQQINTTRKEVVCLECCFEDFCNNKGCGDSMFPERNRRGPMCYDCQHVLNDPKHCNKVTMCSSQEVCSIEKYTWGDDFHYKMGCAHSLCSPMRRAVPTFGNRVERSTPVCSSCCADDFCNQNCTSSGTGGSGPIIVG